MDRYSFLNAVHPSFIAELYDKYLQYPDTVEPSWRAFFQGFDLLTSCSMLVEAINNNALRILNQST